MKVWRHFDYMVIFERSCQYLGYYMQNGIGNNHQLWYVMYDLRFGIFVECNTEPILYNDYSILAQTQTIFQFSQIMTVCVHLEFPSFQVRNLKFEIHSKLFWIFGILQRSLLSRKYPNGIEVSMSDLPFSDPLIYFLKGRFLAQCMTIES